MLTERQQALYDTLFSNGMLYYVSKRHIAELLPQYYTFDSKKQRNGRIIENDVRKINDSGETQYFIISNKNGYKVATDVAEIYAYLDTRMKRDLRSLKLTWKLRKEFAHNHQLYFDDDIEIHEIIHDLEN